MLTRRRYRPPSPEPLSPRMLKAWIRKYPYHTAYYPLSAALRGIYVKVYARCVAAMAAKTEEYGCFDS